MSSVFYETVSEAEQETPGQTTPLVRAYASVLVQELNETASSSSDLESLEVRSFCVVRCGSRSYCTEQTDASETRGGASPGMILLWSRS